MTNKRVWIGRAELEQRPGTGSIIDRHFVLTEVLALADSAADFERTARELVKSIGFELVSIEHSEPLEDRRATVEVGSDLIALAEDVEQSGYGQIGSLHSWKSKD